MTAVESFHIGSAAPSVRHTPEFQGVFPEEAVIDTSRYPAAALQVLDSHDDTLSYTEFLSLIQHDSCKETLQKLQAFCERFPPNLAREEASKKFLYFLDRAEARLLDLPPFTNLSPSQRQQVGFALEKLLIKPLATMFYEIDPNDAISDRLIYEKVNQMQSIDLERHLKGPLVESALIDLAVEELRKIPQYRAPKDKLQCVLNANRVIKHGLEIGNPRTWSADDLLPVMIYCVIRAKPNKLFSDISFIRGFKKMAGETDYVFSSFEWAVEFIRSFDPRVLRPLNRDQRDLLEKISCDFNITDLRIGEVGAFVEECRMIERLLRGMEIVSIKGFDEDARLEKFPMLFDWYKHQVDFIRRLTAMQKVDGS